MSEPRISLRDVSIDGEIDDRAPCSRPSSAPSRPRPGRER